MKESEEQKTIRMTLFPNNARKDKQARFESMSYFGLEVHTFLSLAHLCILYCTKVRIGITMVQTSTSCAFERTGGGLGSGQGER